MGGLQGSGGQGREGENLSEFLIEIIGAISLQLKKQFARETVVEVSAEKAYPGYKGTETSAVH